MRRTFIIAALLAASTAAIADESAAPETPAAKEANVVSAPKQVETPKPPTTYVLEFTPAEVDLLGGAVYTAPLSMQQAVPLYQRIVDQVRAQQQGSDPPAKNGKKPKEKKP